MPNEVLWNAATSISSGISSASINAGANNLGSAIANSTNLDRFVSFDLQFTCSTAPTANKVWEVYILYAIDGTNYEDGDATPTDPTKRPVATIAARAVTSAQRVAVTNVPVAPFSFKFLLKSELDQNATSVTLTAYGHNEDIQ